MKYLSIIELMHTYGQFIKTFKRLMNIDNYTSINAYAKDMDSLLYDDNGVFEPFIIKPVTESEKESTGISKEQNLNEVMLNDVIDISYRVRDKIHSSFRLPPILEMEWLRTKLDLSDEIINVLIQISYLMTLRIMAEYRPNVTDYMRELESRGAIIEVEDLEDTAIILMQKKLPQIKIPTIRSWHTFLFYDTTVKDIIQRCTNQSGDTKEIYYHLPVIFSMFMVDYFGCRLKNWSAMTRIQMVETLKQLAEIEVYEMPRANTYTYGEHSCFTRKDQELFDDIFTTMYEKLQDINKDIGTISVHNYSFIKGPDVVKANVRLSNMKINWDFEMDLAENKKEAENGIDDSQIQEGVTL